MDHTKYSNQRLAGLWFIWIALVIVFSAVFNNGVLMNPGLFAVGFAVGFFILYILPFIKRRLSYGEPTKIQKVASNGAMVLMAVLIMAFVQIIDHSDLRTLWLCIFLSVGIHFIPFVIVHGKSLLLLSGLTIANALLGLIITTVPFNYLALIDAFIKLCFGIYLFSKKRH